MPEQGGTVLAPWVFITLLETGYIPTPTDFTSAENLNPGVLNSGHTLVSPEKLYEHC